MFKQDQTVASTTFAGDANPNSARNFGWTFLLFIVVISPIAMVTALVFYALFALGRIAPKVLAAFVGIYALLLALSTMFFNPLQSYVNSWTLVLGILGKSDTNIGWTIIQSILLQAPLSILLGGILGSGYALWRDYRRPKWMKEATDFRMTPAQQFKLRKNIKDIQRDKNTPGSGRTLGINPDTGERVVQTALEAAAHTLDFGGSGTGKTTGIMGQAHDIIRNGEGIVILDMKGSKDVPEMAYELAQKYDRKFLHWSTQNPQAKYEGPSPDGPAYYDPLGRGDYTRRAQLIMSGREWSEDFYRVMVQEYLGMAFQVAIAVPPQDDRIDSLSDIVTLLDPQELRKRSLKLAGRPEYTDLLMEIAKVADSSEKDLRNSLSSVRKELGILRKSVFGQWLTKDPNHQKDISLTEIANSGAVVVISVSSGSYGDLASTIGNYFINDMMSTADELMSRPSRNPLNIFIDEFSAIESGQIKNLLARCRSANMPVLLSTQTLSDLSVVDREFMGQLTGIVSSFIIHRTNTMEDAEFLAGVAGKEKKMVKRQNVEMSNGPLGFAIGSGTGKGSIEEVEDFIISPSKIQELKKGELYYISKESNRVERVDVIMRDSSGKITNEVLNTGIDDFVAEPDTIGDFLTEEDRRKYAVDPSIAGPQYENRPLDKESRQEWNPYAEVQSRHSNKENLDRIFSQRKRSPESTTPLPIEQSTTVEDTPHAQKSVYENSESLRPETPRPQAPQNAEPSFTPPSPQAMPRFESQRVDPPVTQQQRDTNPGPALPRVTSAIQSRANTPLPPIGRNGSLPEIPKNLNRVPPRLPNPSRPMVNRPLPQATPAPRVPGPQYTRPTGPGQEPKSTTTPPNPTTANAKPFAAKEKPQSQSRIEDWD